MTWHADYDDPSSSLSRRLRCVQARLSDVLTSARPGQLSLISACAGEGRDVLTVLGEHERVADVRALLVESDPVLVARARATADARGLRTVDVVEGDASVTSAFASHVPALVALFCGIFGNISDTDVRETVSLLPSLLEPGGTVIWTRHTGPPDLTGSIRRWFAESGFSEVAFDTEPGRTYAVGTHVLARTPDRYGAGRRMFTFAGDGAGAAS